MLKRRYFPLIFLVPLLFGCTKDVKEYKTATTLNESSWRVEAFWQGYGGADDGWHAWTGKSQKLVFDQSGKGTVFTDGVIDKGAYYQVTSDTTIDEKGDAVQNGSNLRYSIAHDTLVIAGTTCIEGCATRYLQEHTD